MAWMYGRAAHDVEASVEERAAWMAWMELRLSVWMVRSTVTGIILRARFMAATSAR